MPPLASMWRMNGGGHQRDQLVRSCIALLTPFPQAHSLLTPTGASCNWIFFTPQSWLELLGHVTWFPAPRRFSKMSGNLWGTKPQACFQNTLPPVFPSAVKPDGPPQPPSQGSPAWGHPLSLPGTLCLHIPNLHERGFPFPNLFPPSLQRFYLPNTLVKNNKVKSEELSSPPPYSYFQAFPPPFF